MHVALASEQDYLSLAHELKQNALANMHAYKIQEKDDKLTSVTSKASKMMVPSGKPVPKVLVFVSFSMPLQSLKQWIISAHQAQATLVLRGLVNNSFKQTIHAVHQLTQKGIGGISINPIAFDAFAIHKVPAVVVIDQSLSLKEGFQVPKKDFDVMFGDVSLRFALKKIVEQGSVGAQSANKASARLQEALIHGH